MYEEEGSGRGKFIAAGVIFVVAAAGAFGFYKAKGPQSVAPPTTYTAYVAPDKSYKCDGPNGWTRAESVGAGGAQYGVVFRQGTAKVDIIADLQGSLTADIARAQNAQAGSLEGMLPPGMQLPKTAAPKPPVEQLHLAGKKRLTHELTEYVEQPMKEVTIPYGEARISEWSGDAGFWGGGKAHGYRTTILSGERRITVVCQCRESDWPKMKPAFQKIQASIANGGG